MPLSGIANFAIGQFLPEPQTERLIFRRFNGEALARAAASNGSITTKDVTTVALQVNPQEIGFDSQKIINKIPTNAPGRFIVNDWGNDLTVLNIRGSTGQLMPTAITAGFDPAKGFIDDVVQQLDPTNSTATGVGAYKSVTGALASYGQKVLQGGLSYFEQLELSAKYRTFRRLKEEIYDRFDAAMDVLTLEMGQYVYRGYFTNFRFTVTKESPWNWTYEIGFVVINDLSQKIRKEDASFNDTFITKE
jgi:hypothetical protein